MNRKKIAFVLSLALSAGFATLSGNAFAEHSTTDEPAAPMTIGGSNSPGMEEHCDMHKPGMMGGHEGGMMDKQMDGEMCDHESGMKGDHKGGMMGGYGAGMMVQSPGMNMVKSLDLSSEQRSKINKLSDTLRHDNWAAMGLIMDESAKLRDLYAADKRNPSAIGKEYQKIFDLQRQMIEAMIETENRADELLTPEQRAQLKSMHRKMGAMRGYPMH